jgi:ribosome-associated protein
VERLRQLLQDALKPVPIRKKTRPSAASRRRRLEEKKQRSQLTRQRAERDRLAQ